jgi:hypothetical protein
MANRGMANRVAEPTEREAWIQEVCDQLHRLEALISVAVPSPPKQPAPVEQAYVYFESALN